MMKKVFWMMIGLFFALGAAAQQVGIVRTLEKANRPSQGLEGVTVSILEYPNALVSKKDGKFSFTIPGKKSGDAFKVSRVTKKGYSLVDKHLQGRRFSYSSSVPVEIVMVSDKQLAADKKMIEDKAYAKAKKTYEARVAELERQLNEKIIDEQAYYAERERLSNDYDSYTQLISDMAERYALTDYKGLSDINRQIMECIENADLERADSLINSKGDFDQREQELRSQMAMNQATADFLAQSQRDAAFKLNDLAQDYYNKFTIHAGNYRNDSAAYYLMRRAALDTTNVEWQNEAGLFVYEYLANYELALDYFNLGLRQAKTQDGEQSEQAASFLLDIGLVYFQQGDYAQALANFQKVEGMVERDQGNGSPLVATSYNNIGSVYDCLGDYTNALLYYQKALDIRERDLGADHPLIATSYNNIGRIYYSQGDYVQALAYFQKMQDLAERVLGTEHPVVAKAISNMGTVYMSQNNYPQALECYQKALSINERTLGADHPEVASLYDNIGLVYSSQGEYEMALKYHLMAQKINERVFGSGHPDVATTYNNIGLAYYHLGDLTQALVYSQKALDILERRLGVEHPNTQLVKKNFEKLKEKMGQ